MNDYTPSVKDIIETWAIATPNRGMSVPDRMRAAERAVAAHDAEVRAGVVAEEPEWEYGVVRHDGVMVNNGDYMIQQTHRRRKAGAWVPVDQEGADHEGDA